MRLDKVVFAVMILWIYLKASFMYTNPKMTTKRQSKTTLLVLMYEIRQSGICCNDFVDLSKSFFYVYKSQDDYKKAIKDHIGNKLSRYNFIFNNIRTLDASNFEDFLQENNL